MNYRDTLLYLDLVQQRGIKLGLETMWALLREMGNPERTFPAVIVAGTNGKGSTSAFIASVLVALGRKTGLYTSPHLVRYEERIAVNGVPIEEDGFCATVSHVRDIVDRSLAQGSLPSHPTHFEILTAAAFQHFREAQVEIAVLEVGMGGRHDAVAAAAARVAVITNISLEHTEHLGATVEAIAAEKAGVIHDGCTVITGEARPGPLAVIRAAAQGRGVRLIERHREARIDPSHSAAAGRFRLATSVADYGELILPLPGRHQVENATLAVLAIEALAEQGLCGGPVSRDHIALGLARTQWPGRLQILSHDPLFLLDGAHNPAGAAALAATLRDLRASGLYRDLTLVFGVLADKDHEAMTRELFPLADRLVLTRGESDRFRDPATLTAPVNVDDFRVTRNLEEALNQAKEITPRDGAICLCGSLYLVGEALAAMKIDPYR